MTDRYKINAVLDEDLEIILELKGILEDLKNGMIDCFVCGEKLSLQNIGAIHIINGETKLCCDDEECINT